MMLGLALWLAAVPAAWADALRIAALGDSLTQGYGLPEPEGFVPQLQAWLRAEGIEATVVNAGVSGDTTAGGRSRLDWTLEGGAIDAMIVTLGGNDILRGIDPAVSRDNLEAIVQGAQEAGVPVFLVGMRAAANYGPDYKAAFDAIYPELSQQYGTGYYPSFFAGLTEDENALAAYRKYMQPDGIHPSAEGVARIVGRMGPALAEWLRGLPPASG